jgi:hypothetical protein
MQLKDNAHRLAREHLKMDRDGKPHKVPALLTDLRGAVTPGRTSSGGGASGPPIPIDPDALDLLREIETEARRDYHEISGEYWAGELEALVLRLAEMDMTADWSNYLAHTTLDWCDRITAMLWPVRPRRKLVGKVCPSCGWATYGEERKTCLSLGCWDSEGAMKKVGEWDIECGSCEAGWTGEQMIFLLRALDTHEAEVLAPLS